MRTMGLDDLSHICSSYNAVPLMPAGDVCYAHMAGVPQDATHPYSVPVPFIWRFIIICESGVGVLIQELKIDIGK